MNPIMLEAKLRLLLKRVVNKHDVNHPLAVKIRQRITELQLTEIDRETKSSTDSEDWSKEPEADAEQKAKDFWRDINGASEEAA